MGVRNLTINAIDPLVAIPSLAGACRFPGGPADRVQVTDAFRPRWVFAPRGRPPAVDARLTRYSFGDTVTLVRLAVIPGERIGITFPACNREEVCDGRVPGEALRAADVSPQRLYRAGQKRRRGSPRGPQPHGRSDRTLGPAQPRRTVRVTSSGATRTFDHLGPGCVVHGSAGGAPGRRRPTTPLLQRAEVRDAHGPSAGRTVGNPGTIGADSLSFA